MKSTDAPSKQAVPFGTNGPREAITATTPSGSNQASYDQGFPPITMTLKSAGGLPPKGQDMNQILFEQSSFNRYFAAGGGYVYDSTFSTAVGGYPLSARIPNSTGTGFWFNTVEDNQTNPENSTAALTGWIPMGSYGVTALTGLASASITLTTLQASKDRITLAGTLTANINIVVPAWVKRWEIVNNLTGSFSVTIKTPSGTGVTLAAGVNSVVFGDGTNVVTNNSPGSLINSLRIMNTSSYTPSPGTKKIRVRAVAGGGASGSEAASSGSNGGISQAGYYGQYIEVIIPISVLPPTVSVVVGSGGTPGAAGQVTGGTGGDTSFGSIFTLQGGPGGSSMPITTGAAANGSSIANRSVTSTITPLNSSGGITKSSTTIQVTAGTGVGQMPLPSPIEGGYYGSGGIGIFASATAQQGNPGIGGIVIIEEYA